MSFKVTQQARLDLFDIGRYTQRRWGKAQRRQYLNDLNKQFQLISDNPQIGRECNDIREAYCPLEFMSHIIFYKLDNPNVLISRILHKSRDVQAQLIQKD